ncbi:pentatricopeptide repeat-containing protein [Dorcoceras hygrometricum]|nr:pentatricopeptide repeat-containing protein [Dorcoceras hygrometricum]
MTKEHRLHFTVLTFSRSTMNDRASSKCYINHLSKAKASQDPYLELRSLLLGIKGLSIIVFHFRSAVAIILYFFLKLVGRTVYLIVFHLSSVTLHGT